MAIFLVSGIIPRLILVLLISTLIIHPVCAAKYFAPDKDLEIFHLEKIPLTVGAMKEISNNLVTLSCRKQNDSPENRRASAQLLAIAIRLDLTNQKTKRVNKIFTQGGFPKHSESKEFSKTLSSIQNYLKWLSSPEAGENANLLSNYLFDATKYFHKGTQTTPEKANWKGIVPPLETYFLPKKETVQQPKPIIKKPTPSLQPKQNTPVFQIQKLNTALPLITYTRVKYRKHGEAHDRTRKAYKEELTPIQMIVSPSQNTKIPFSILFSPDITDNSKKPLKNIIQQNITRYLKNKHEKLPDQRITIKIKNGEYSEQNKTLIVAPILMMLEASLTNTQIHNNIQLLAEIDVQGNLKTPKNIWHLIEQVRKSQTSGILIVPQECAGLLPQFLAFDDPEFFTRYEIFSASNLDQALNIAALKPLGKLKNSRELFQTICEVSKKTALTKLTINKAVRTRLNNILQLYPNHQSANALLIQGSGKRPMKLNKKATAHAIRPTLIKFLTFLNSLPKQELPNERIIKNKIEAINIDFSQLAKKRFINKSSGKLYPKTASLINNSKRLFTLARRINNNKDSNKSDQLSTTANSLIFSLQEETEELLKEIETAIAK